jgi:hypothetical protein
MMASTYQRSILSIYSEIVDDIPTVVDITSPLGLFSDPAFFFSFDLQAPGLARDVGTPSAARPLKPSTSQIDYRGTF